MKSFVHLCLLGGLAGLSLSVRAEPSRDEGPPPHIRAALEACAVETKVAAPVPGKEASEEDRKKIDACMSAKGFAPPPSRPGEDSRIRAMLDACITETGVARLEPGQQPSEGDRKKVDACMKGKGFDPPAAPELKKK